MQRFAISFVTTVLSIGFMLLAVFFPVLAVPCALVSTTLFAFVCSFATHKISRITSQTVVAVFYIITLIVTKDPVPGLLMLSMFFPVGLALGTSVQLRKNLNYAGALALIYGAVFFLLIFAAYAVFTTYPDISFSVAAENIQEMIIPEIESVISQLLEGEQIVSGEYDYIYSYESIASLAFSYIPTVVALLLLGSTAVVYPLLKAIFKYYEVDSRFMGRFSGFKVSKAGAITYFLATVASVLAMGTTVSTAAVNFTAVMSFVLSYAGVSLISFLLDLKNISDPVKYIIIGVLLFLGLMPFGFSYLLSLVGLADAYLNIRGRLKNSGV